MEMRFEGYFLVKEYRETEIEQAITKRLEQAGDQPLPSPRMNFLDLRRTQEELDERRPRLSYARRLNHKRQPHSGVSINDCLDLVDRGLFEERLSIGPMGSVIYLVQESGGSG